MGNLELNGDNCLKLLRKQFPGEWQGLLNKARRMITLQRRKMKGVVSVQMAAAACIMANGPALSIMAASWIMARQEQLLQQHIELDLEVNRMIENAKVLVAIRGLEAYQKSKIANEYDIRISNKLKQIDWILMEIMERALTMGEKPHTLRSGYCPRSFKV